ncbi:unnamed protein product [Urochloa humidicola]
MPSMSPPLESPPVETPVESPPLALQWVLLSRVAVIQLNSDDALGCVAITPSSPPKTSVVTIPRRCIPQANEQDHDGGGDIHVVVLAADPAGLLLHASKCRLVGLKQDLDPRGILFMARGFFAAGASCAAADVVRIPDRARATLGFYNNMRNVGLLSLPGSGGTDYVIAELRFDDWDQDRATLLSFRAGKEAWVERKVSCFLMPGIRHLWHCDDVVALDGMLWWVDLEVGVLACNPLAENLALRCTVLPTKTLPDNPMAKLPRNMSTGMVRVSQGKVRFVDIIHAQADPQENAKLTIWTLIVPPSGFPWWELQSSTSFGALWSSEGYVKSGMPEVVPVLLHIDPTNTDVIYFLLENQLFSVNVAENKVVHFMYNPAVPADSMQPAINWRYVLAWDLASSLDNDNISMPFDEFIAALDFTLPDEQEQMASHDQQIEEMEVEPDNSGFQIMLPSSYHANQSLEISEHYNYATAQELVAAVVQNKSKWVSRPHAHALLSNPHIFMLNFSISDSECLCNGRTALLSHESWSSLKLDYARYTTTSRPLKERKLKEDDNSLIQRYEVKGNLWTRRRIHLKNDTSFHLMQWRVSQKQSHPQVNLPSEDHQQQLLKTIQDLATTNKELVSSVKEISTGQKELMEACIQNQKELKNALVQMTQLLK